MKRIKVFISSVQSEFAEERQQLFDYLTTDALLGRFFDPFIFENLPAVNHSVSTVFLREVENCHVYLGLFGKQYGYVDAEGISPVEREFDHAVIHHKTRLIFLSNHPDNERHPKEVKLIKKAEKIIVRRQFSTWSDLKSAIYSSLIRYLEEKEYIRTVPFDATLNLSASIGDLDSDKIKEFVHIARSKRGFPLSEEAATETILIHLNLLDNNRISNAGILLFGKQPQRFFMSSEIRCAHFHGTEIVKPIPSYQVFKGDVFQLVNQAVDFILSKIDVSVGTRELSSQAPVHYELPSAAVSEAIVNAVAHRDYTSNASIQVMLFKDRLEIWNPGSLPFGLDTAKLRLPHTSIPANLLLAGPLYLSGYIERLGTGTGDIIRLCKDEGLKEPDFIQEDIFKTIIWRKTEEVIPGEVSGQASLQATLQATLQVDEEFTSAISRVLIVLKGRMKRTELQQLLGLKDRASFISNYLNPASEKGYIEMTFPESPNHPNQQYRLTKKGSDLKKKLKKTKRR
jgi:ATP-dependent DNA helicase RecG